MEGVFGVASAVGAGRHFVGAVVEGDHDLRAGGLGEARGAFGAEVTGDGGDVEEEDVNAGDVEELFDEAGVAGMPD